MKLLVFAIFSAFVIACASAYKDSRESSVNFKAGIFLNLEAQDKKSFWQFLKMRFSTEWPSWPEWIETKQHKPFKQRVGAGEYHITHINHSTVLIQTHNLNVLTDPIYSERCSPVSFAGPKRVQTPGVAFDDLPKIDVILISHDHYDHLDLETIKMLVKRDQPKIYLGLGVGRHLAGTDIPFVEMDWWQSSRFNPDLEVSFVPVQHFSGRGLFDRNSTLWGGYVIQFPTKKIYFGGDTGYAGHFLETQKRYGAMDISILPIGAYAPRSFMKFAHMDPFEAVQAHVDLQSKKSFGVHYGTFQLTAEPIGEPKEALLKALAEKNIPVEDFSTPEFGTTVVLN